MPDHLATALLGGLIGSLVGGLFALLALLLTQRFESERVRDERKAITDRWYAEPFLKHKLEILSKLQAKLVAIQHADEIANITEIVSFKNKETIPTTVEALITLATSRLNELNEAYYPAFYYLSYKNEADIAKLISQLERLLTHYKQARTITSHIEAIEWGNAIGDLAADVRTNLGRAVGSVGLELYPATLQSFDSKQ